MLPTLYRNGLISNRPDATLLVMVIAPIQRWLRRMYDWVVGWAETRHANTALFLIAFAESSFFPIPPDVLLIAMGVGAPRRSLHFAAICLVGSVLGGLFGYWIGLGFWGIAQDWFYTYVPNFTPEIFAKVTQMYHDNAFLALFTAGFTPIPYKVFTIAGGVAEISLGVFIGASICSRGLRFFLVGGLLRVFGAKIHVFIEKYFNLLTIAFTVLLIGGILAVKVFLK